MIKTITKSEELALLMVEAIQEKKGKNIKLLDLRGLDYSITDFFVVCEAESGTQINAIYESIDEVVKKKLGQDPHHVEGRDESIWVLLDYIDAVAHIFQPESREFYRLEALWAEAKVTEYN